MDNYRHMALFAQVVRHGSFSAAGRALGMSTSAVSQQIRRLERDAGVPLMHRTTRSLTLTEVGKRYLDACVRLLEAAEEATAQLTASWQQPEGVLRMSAPLGMGDVIGAALGPWLQAHPALRLHLQLEEGWTDLLRARMDLAIRAGQLPDSDWMAEPLGRLERWLCASADWVDRHGLPADPQRLGAAGWIATPASNDWTFRHRRCGDTRVVVV